MKGPPQTIREAGRQCHESEVCQQTVPRNSASASKFGRLRNRAANRKEASRKRQFAAMHRDRPIGSIKCRLSASDRFPEGLVRIPWLRWLWNFLRQDRGSRAAVSRNPESGPRLWSERLQPLPHGHPPLSEGALVDGQFIRDLSPGEASDATLEQVPLMG